jgi:hypothetical protein
MSTLVVNIMVWWEMYEQYHSDGYCSGGYPYGERTDQDWTNVQIPVSEYKAGRRGGISLKQFTTINQEYACESYREFGHCPDTYKYCAGRSWKRAVSAKFASPADEELVRHITWVRTSVGVV